MGTVVKLTTRHAHEIDKYTPNGFFCELLGGKTSAEQEIQDLFGRIRVNSFDDLARRAKAAENELSDLGITFTIYSQREAIDRILPFDIIPRVLAASDWRVIETGIKQRVTATNQFLWDIYHDQHILNDGTVPRDLVMGNVHYCPEMKGYDVNAGTYVHVSGTDIVRDERGTLMVLEDNARTPSGVSYVIENRRLMQRAFPDLVASCDIRSVSDYGNQLVEKLLEVAPSHIDDPQIVLLSPGIFNSAYFEHVFLAREMGVTLVEGRDLVVDGDRLFMKTISGLHPIHVVYRRIDDDFLDPEVFRSDSVLGVSGLMRAQAAGNVVLANALGTGVADDKATYAYMPRITRYYLGEEPILPNVETHICREPDGLNYTLEHAGELVIKPVDESGGYGIIVGPHSSRSEIENCRRQVKENPSKYISQPMVHLSVCPTMSETAFEPRHVDLRPFALTGRNTWVLPGGLTRVALKRGSIIVNSSQGGGTKDTWVLEE